CDMGFEISMAIIGVALAIVGMVVPGGQAAALSNFAKMAQLGSDIATATMGVVTGAGDIAVGVVRYEAAREQADATKLKGEAKEMEALIQQLDDFIDQAIQRLIGASDRFNAVLDGLMDAVNDRAQSTSRVKFTG